MREKDYYRDKYDYDYDYDYDRYEYEKKDKNDCEKRDKWEYEKKDKYDGEKRDKWEYEKKDKYDWEKKDKWECEKKDKGEKDKNSAYAGSKAVAINKNWNILCVPSGRYDADDEAMRRGEGDPYDFEDMLKKGYDGDDGKEAEAAAYGKAVICNKNINVVIGY